MFILRDMETSDIKAVVEIISAHQKIDGRMARKYYKEYFLRMKRAKTDREKNIIAITEEGEIAGIIGYTPDKYDLPGILWLSWFYVKQKHRGRGLGSMLLNYIIDEARNLGVRKLYIDSSSDESYASAARLYRRFNFKGEGRLIDYYGSGEDAILWGFVL